MPRKSEQRREMGKETKQLLVRLPNDLHLELKLKCVKEGRPMQEILMEGVKKYVGHN
jgi:hypothetical protein